MPQNSLSQRFINLFPDLRTEGQKAHDERKYNTSVLEGWLEHREEIEKNSQANQNQNQTRQNNS
jgi:hypothetical protein